jgi:hypothetical protein
VNKPGTAGPVISHPTGGGAIRRLGGTFSPDLHTGTGNLSVPIALAWRAGLHPELIRWSVAVGMVTGHSGWDWALSVPGVSRDIANGFLSTTMKMSLSCQAGER